MVAHNEDPRKTAYTVSVDASSGITTGISASDRTRTLRALADPLSTPDSLIRPGHIVPLKGAAGGVRERAGHTEASIELMIMAGLEPVAVIGEVVGDDGELLRLPQLLEFGARENIPVITIKSLIEELDAEPVGGRPSPRHQVVDDQRVIFEVETRVPTQHGVFDLRAYRDRATGFFSIFREFGKFKIACQFGFNKSPLIEPFEKPANCTDITMLCVDAYSFCVG